MLKKRTIFKKIIVVVVLLLVLFLIIKVQPKQNISENPYFNANLQIKTYQGVDGWGYDIYNNGRLLIHQPNIPALPGNSGFIIEKDAEEVAKLVVDKIKGNIMPPTLTLEDLKNIGIGK